MQCFLGLVYRVTILSAYVNQFTCEAAFIQSAPQGVSACVVYPAFSFSTGLERTLVYVELVNFSVPLHLQVCSSHSSSRINYISRCLGVYFKKKLATHANTRGNLALFLGTEVPASVDQVHRVPMCSPNWAC